MSPAWSMVGSAFLFATMGVCVKLASEHYSAYEIVMYRGLVGAVVLGAVARWRRLTLRTTLPGAHAWRSIVGVTALVLWFMAIGGLPLATGITLNYTSSLWMAVFLVGAAAITGSARVDTRLIAAVLVGFVGVALVLKPTVSADQWLAGLVGLTSGVISALAYLQVAALGRAGEPETRTVFYFSLGSMIAGTALSAWTGFQTHSLWGATLLLAVGVLATVAQMLLTHAYTAGKPMVNASLAYLSIVFSVLYGLWLFEESLTWSSVLGMMLIVAAGLVAARVQAGRSLKHSPQRGDASAKR